MSFILFFFFQFCLPSDWIPIIETSKSLSKIVSHKSVILDSMLYTYGGVPSMTRDKRYEAHLTVANLTEAPFTKEVNFTVMLTDTELCDHSMSIITEGSKRGELVVLGGLDSKGLTSRDIYRFMPNKIRHSYHRNCPQQFISRYGHGSFTVNDLLYIWGGNTRRMDNNMTIYNLTSRIWKTINTKKYPKQRYYFASAMYIYNDINRNITLHYYFIHGGLSFDQNEILCDLWYYIVEKNEWHELHTTGSNNKHCRYLHSGVFYKDLFIIHGGLYPYGLGESVSGITLVLNITERILIWNKIKDLNYPRAGYSMVVDDKTSLYHFSFYIFYLFIFLIYILFFTLYVIGGGYYDVDLSIKALNLSSIHLIPSENDPKPYPSFLKATIYFSGILTVTILVVCVYFVFVFVREIRRRRRFQIPLIPREPIVAADDKEIMLLPETVYNSCDFVNYDTCSICLSSFEEGEKIKILCCNHIFHSECIENWLVYNRKCPLCKQDATGRHSLI